MQITIIVRINWWENENVKNITFNHLEELLPAAEERIFEMRKDCYTSGELHHVTEDGTNYNGFWDFNY
jgi:predicted metal-dependent hydrolase